MTLGPRCTPCRIVYTIHDHTFIHHTPRSHEPAGSCAVACRLHPQVQHVVACLTYIVPSPAVRKPHRQPSTSRNSADSPDVTASPTMLDEEEGTSNSDSGSDSGGEGSDHAQTLSNNPTGQNQYPDCRSLPLLSNITPLTRLSSAAGANDDFTNGLLIAYHRHYTNRKTVSKLLSSEHGIKMRCDTLPCRLALLFANGHEAPPPSATDGET